MFDQRMFTSFLQQTALLITGNHDNEQTRQTTCQPDNPPRTTASSTSRSENGSATRQLTQHGFDDCPMQPVALRLTNRSHAVRLQRHPPAFDACRCSNMATQAHLRSTLQITRVDNNSHLHARRHFTQRISRNHHKYPDSWKASTSLRPAWRPQGVTNTKRHSSTIHHRTQQHHFDRIEHLCPIAFLHTICHPNDCLLQFSTILEHFGSQVHSTRHTLTPHRHIENYIVP